MSRKRNKYQNEMIDKQLERNWKKKTFYITTSVTIIGIIISSIISVYVTKSSINYNIYNGDIITYQAYSDAIKGIELVEEEKEEAYNISAGQSIAVFATKYCIGKPYAYGGTSLISGTDSSGLLVNIFKKYGIDLPHSSKKIQELGEEVLLSEIRDGDIVCYDGHVGIYVGEDMIVHASNVRWGITISKMYYREPISIRRFNFAEAQKNK